MKNLSQTKSRFRPIADLAALLTCIAGITSTALSQVAGPTNGLNGAAFPAVPNGVVPLESSIVKEIIGGKPHYKWNQAFRSAGYHGLMWQNISTTGVSDADNALSYPDQFDRDQADPNSPPPPGGVPNPGIPFGSRLPISLFASPGPGDFLDPSPTLGGTSVPMLPPGAAGMSTGWNGLFRPTLDGAVDLISGVPLARVVDLELPFDGATFRISRTRSATRGDNRIGKSESIPDQWWDWTGLGWMTGENPLLLIDSCVPDMAASGNRTTWLALDAFHSIPFQFIESSGQYEAPPRFRATIAHDGAWGVGTRSRRNFTTGALEQVQQRGWLKRPQQYTVSLYDGQLRYFFVAIQKGGEQPDANLRDDVADCEDVPPHFWDVRWGAHDPDEPMPGCTDPEDCIPYEFRSHRERPITPADANSMDGRRYPYISEQNPGIGLPTLGLLTRIEDSYGHIVEMHYSPVHQRPIPDLNDIPNDPNDDRDDNLTEVFQDNFRRGQLHYIELKKAGANNTETTLWTLLYAHRLFEGNDGWLRNSTNPRYSQWLNNTAFSAFRDELDCYDGSLAIEAVYAYPGPVTGIETSTPITVSPHAPYPTTEDDRVLLDGSDDPLEHYNTTHTALSTAWQHRIRHSYRYDTSPEHGEDANENFAHTIGAPILIKTTVTSYRGIVHTEELKAVKNTVYQYSTNYMAEPIEMRVESGTTILAAKPWSERRNADTNSDVFGSGIPWLDRIFTDDDLSRLQTWAASVSPENTEGVQARSVGIPELAAHYGMDADGVTEISQATWAKVHSFASVSWAQRLTESWPLANGSNVSPGVTACLNDGYLSFNTSDTHLYGNDNMPGTVNRLVIRAGDATRCYQINRAQDGPTASTRGQAAPTGFLELAVFGNAGNGCTPMRSRFVAPYYWSGYPNDATSGTEGAACWATAPELDKARWVVMVDAFVDSDSFDGVSEPTYGASALRSDQVSRHVHEINPSGVTIRERHWDTKSGTTSLSQLGFAKSYKYERVSKLFESELTAITNQMPADFKGLDALKSESLLVEERTIGWSAVEGAQGQTETNGLIIFHEFDWVPFGYDIEVIDSETKTITPNVDWNQFVQPNAHGIRRGTEGTKFYTKQYFRAPVALRRPSDILCEIDFVSPATTRLSAAPTPTESIDPEQIHATFHITSFAEQPDKKPWEYPITAQQTIGIPRRLFPGTSLTELYYPVEKQWFNASGQTNWSCSGLVKDPIDLLESGSSWDGFESLTFSHVVYSDGKISYSVEDAKQPFANANAPGSDLPAFPVAEYPDGLSRIPDETALNRATVYAYNGPAGDLSDIWYPDGRRFAKRVSQFAPPPSTPQQPFAGTDAQHRSKGWRETFVFTDLVLENGTWRALKPGQWSLSGAPAQASFMSADGVRSGGWDPAPPIEMSVAWDSFPSNFLSAEKTLTKYADNDGFPGANSTRIQIDFDEAKVLVTKKSHLDSNGRVTTADLEEDVNGVFLGVGTKEINDLVDVLREREIDGTITRTTRDFFGHPLRKYVGTDDIDFNSGEGNLVMLERQEYGGGETNAWLPTVHRRYTTDFETTDRYSTIDPATDSLGIATVTSYDWRMRPVRIDSYAKGVFNPPSTLPRRLSTKLTYLDHAGRTHWEVTFGSDPVSGNALVIPSSLDPSKLGGTSGSVAQLMPTSAEEFFALEVRPTSLVQNLFAPDGSIQETRTYDLASTTIALYQSSFTYKGIGGQEVYAQRPGQPIQIQVLHPAGHLLKTISVRPDADAIDPETRYELSRTELVYDDQLNVVERISYERSVYDTQVLLSTSNAAISRQWSWYDDAKRLVATADFGTEIFSGSPPQRAGAARPVSVTGFLYSVTAQINLFEYDSAGNQVASTAPNGKRTEKVYSGSGKVLTVKEDATGLARETKYEYKWGRLAAMKFDRLRDSSAATATQTTRLWFSEGNGSNNGLGVTATNVVDDSFTEVSQNGSYIGKVWFPHRETGAAGNYPVYLEDFNFKYNFAGQIAERKDARGIVFRYTYDDLGRLSEIQVGHYSGSTFVATYPDDMNCATGVPQDRIEQVMFAYDNRGNQILVTAKTADGMITQNQFEYSQRDDLLKEWQAFGGEVITSGTDPTPAIDYDWSWQATSGTSQVGHHRLTQMTYPAQPNITQRRVVNFSYGSSGSLDDKISRIKAMETTYDVSGSPANVAMFDWSGTGRRIRQSQANDKIIRETGVTTSNPGLALLDHFGRPADFAFRNTDSAGGSGIENVLYRAQYGYDAVGNRNLVTTYRTHRQQCSSRKR